MKLAFALFKYFPYGGLQRDCMKIALECLRRGHQVDVYCLEWDGSVPDGINVEVLSVNSLFNYRRYEQFADLVNRKVAKGKYAGLIGFNRMAGLDLYYAADPCYAAKVSERSFVYRMLPRTRSFLASEEMVFGKDGNCHALLISPAEKKVFHQIYDTPNERMTLLPPGIQRDRLRPPDYPSIRQQKRQELGLEKDALLLLMVGSGFRTKGVDRSLKAVAALPEEIRDKVMLYVVGRDNVRPFERMATQLGLEKRVVFTGGRDDVPQLLFAADVLLHPAYRENTGTVLLEAMAAGLPQIVSGVCGYSFHVAISQSGHVLPEPFDQHQLNESLGRVIKGEGTDDWYTNAQSYIEHNDIFALSERAADTIERVLTC